MTDLLPSADAPTRSPRRAAHGSEPNTPDQAQRTRLVVDTSVLIADPTCVLEFQDADVIVPLTVVEELDGLKSRPDDVGRSARTALRTLEELRVDRRIWVVGTAGEAGTLIYDADLRGPLALVLGGEEKGLRRLTREHCDQLVHLPMAGVVESLNVSVAAGVCLFEAVRQRRRPAAGATKTLTAP